MVRHGYQDTRTQGATCPAEISSLGQISRPAQLTHKIMNNNNSDDDKW